MPRRKIFSDFFKNFSYTFAANVLSILISMIITFIVPKLISLDMYGYYQLYLFYTNYVGVSYLGLCDGIYLRVGGRFYDDLDKPLYSAQFRMLGIFETVLYACIFGVTLAVASDESRRFVIACVCAAAVGMCLRWFITFILQATARIREYVTVTISERVIFMLAAVPAVLAGYRGFKFLVVADVAAKYISLFIGMWYCRDMVTAKASPVREVIPEVRENISVGFKFMIAELSDMLIIGVVRFGIQSRWDVATFSKVSFTLTVSSLVMTGITAVSTVMYPTLRRTGKDRLPSLYGMIRAILVGFGFGALVMYYPLRRVLSVWLPQYTDSLRYAAVLFPVCIYQSKMSMLVNTYYKTLRLEKLLMKCNVITLALSVVCTFVSTLVLDSVNAAIFSILLVLIFRCVISEILLSRHIDIDVGKDTVLELAMTVAFIVCNRFFGFAGMLAYAVCYVLYLAVKRKDIKQAFAFVKSMR